MNFSEIELPSSSLDKLRDNQTIFDENIEEYMQKELAAKDDKKINELIENYGLDKKKLIDLLNQHPDSYNLNSFNRFDELLDSVDKDRASSFYEEKAYWKIKNKVRKDLQEFVLTFHNE